MTYTTRQKIALLALVFAALVLFALGKGVSTDLGGPLRGLAAELLRLFGLSGFLFPVLVGATAWVQLWRTHYLARRRWSMRLLGVMPLVSIMAAALGMPFGLARSWGGSFGAFMLQYAECALGIVGGYALVLIVLMQLTRVLWQLPLPDIRGVFRWLMPALREAVATSQRKLSGRSKPLIPTGFLGSDYSVPQRPSPDQTSSNPIANDTLPWMNGVNKPHPESTEQPMPQVNMAEHATLQPGWSQPLPLSILPLADAQTLAEPLDKSALESLSMTIRDVVQRTADLELEPLAPPRIGMSGIRFFLRKVEGQRVSIRRVERCLADLGVETGRAPVRVAIGGDIMFEMPLHDGERRFAPILPLLQDTRTDSTTEPPASALSYLFGRRQDGGPFELPLRDARHLLVAGSTGGGKSVLLHSLIFGFIFRYPPKRVRLALVDLKALEFDIYRGLPHLWQDVVTESSGLQVLIARLHGELQRRKAIRRDDPAAELPALVTIIDEFSGYDSPLLIRLIAEARALDMYFVLATQHPTAETISTAIKANLITSVAVRTRNASASHLILNCADAAGLQAKGDCLVSSPMGLERIQAGWVSGSDGAANSDLAALRQWISSRNRDRI